MKTPDAGRGAGRPNARPGSRSRAAPLQARLIAPLEGLEQVATAVPPAREGATATSPETRMATARAVAVREVAEAASGDEAGPSGVRVGQLPVPVGRVP